VKAYAKDDFMRRIRNAGFKLDRLSSDWFGTYCFDRLGIAHHAALYVVERSSL
jgi:hypothetical protein